MSSHAAAAAPVLPDNGHECQDWIAAMAAAGVTGLAPTTGARMPGAAALVVDSGFGFTYRVCAAESPKAPDGTQVLWSVSLLVTTGSSAAPAWAHLTSDLPSMAPCATPAPTQSVDVDAPYHGLQPCVPQHIMTVTSATDGVLHGPDQGGGQDPLDTMTNLYLYYEPARTVVQLNLEVDAPADADALRDKAFAATWDYLTRR